MADNKEARDEKLIEELYERLWWYTHEASDEEFDEKEVDAITRLLDVLEPVHDDQAFASGADAALKRFWERYGEEEEDAGLAEAAGVSDAASPDLPGKDTVPPCPSPNRSGWKKRFLRLGIGLAACAVLLVSVNIGCYALKKKSFFEIGREEVGRTEITVTGNVEDKNDNIECSSWEEVEKIVGEKLLKPTYLPTGYAVKSIIIQSLRPVGIIVGRYEDNEGHYLRVEIDIYDESYTKSAFYYDKDWELLEEDGDLGILYYGKEEVVEAFFVDQKCVYYVSNNQGIDTLKEIVSKIK